MAHAKSPRASTTTPALARPPVTRTAKIADKGIRTDREFSSLMSALMSDLVAGRIPPNVGNATCNAGGKLLRVVELTYRYGVRPTKGSRRRLQLASA